MKTILSLMIVALVATPLVAADPIAGVGAIQYIDTAWATDGATGTCTDRVTFTTTEVFLKLIVSAQTARGTVPPLGIAPPDAYLPDAPCALIMTITPGVYTNPCQLLKGEVGAPAVTTDPYFTKSNGVWRKTIVFPDGGYVSYAFKTGYQYEAGRFEGSCRSGTATGTWGSHVYAAFV